MTRALPRTLNISPARNATIAGRSNYLLTLDGAWRAHLAPREPNAPTVISLFAGCGGSSLGYSMAGFRELLAVEWDDNAVATFRANFPDVPIWHGDVAKLSVGEVLERTGLEPGELDVLDGSPPCQGFSTAGKRILDDPRNSLFAEYVRLLRGLKPRAFIMENVSGMVKGKMKLVFAEIIKELRADHYTVRAWLLNAMHYGVPQSRARMIFVGLRDGDHNQITAPPRRSRLISVKEAIGHIPMGCPGNHSEQVLAAWDKSAPRQSLRKANRFVGSFQSVRLDPNKPSTTQIKAHLNWRWDVARQLSIREAALIGSFPEEFVWPTKKMKAKNQIGNSVPPLFMQAIAGHVRKTLLESTGEPFPEAPEAKEK